MSLNNQTRIVCIIHAFRSKVDTVYLDVVSILHLYMHKDAIVDPPVDKEIKFSRCRRENLYKNYTCILYGSPLLVTNTPYEVLL